MPLVGVQGQSRDRAPPLAVDDGRRVGRSKRVPFGAHAEMKPQQGERGDRARHHTRARFDLLSRRGRRRRDERILALERLQRALRPLHLVVLDQERPLAIAERAQLVLDALLVEHQRQIHRAPEIGDEAQQHDRSLRSLRVRRHESRFLALVEVERGPLRVLVRGGVHDLKSDEAGGGDGQALPADGISRTACTSGTAKSAANPAASSMRTAPLRVSPA